MADPSEAAASNRIEENQTVSLEELDYGVLSYYAIVKPGTFIYSVGVIRFHAILSYFISQ